MDPDVPSRRRLAQLIVASAGLAVLSACSAGTERSGSVSASSTASTPATSTHATSTPATVPSPPAVPVAVPSPDVYAGGLAPSATSAARSLIQQFSLSDPGSQWVLVNKHHALSPESFVPADLVPAALPGAAATESGQLRAVAASAAQRMFADAATAGVFLTMLSGFRSYQTQVATYNHWLAVHGSVAGADTASARPGFSEHQTGLALDIGDVSGACSLQPCFAGTPAAVWAAANGQKYGFIVRYQLNHDAVTGFYAESWHLRFVGTELALDLTMRGIPTLEEYFGLPAAPGYE